MKFTSAVPTPRSLSYKTETTKETKKEGGINNRPKLGSVVQKFVPARKANYLKESTNATNAREDGSNESAELVPAASTRPAKYLEESRTAINAREDSSVESAERPEGSAEIPSTVTKEQDKGQAFLKTKPRSETPGSVLSNTVKRQSQKLGHWRRPNLSNPNNTGDLIENQNDLTINLDLNKDEFNIIERLQDSNASNAEPQEILNRKSSSSEQEKTPSGKSIPTFDTIERLLDPNTTDAEIQALLNPAPTPPEQETLNDAANETGQPRIDAKSASVEQQTVDEKANPKKLEYLASITRVKTLQGARMSTVSRTLAPTTSAKMAQIVATMIKDHDGDKPKALRALHIFYCAAGGEKKFCLPNRYPETDACADALVNLRPDQRSEYLDALYSKLEKYLPPTYKDSLKSRLGRIAQAAKLGEGEKTSRDNYLGHVRTETMDEIEKYM